MSEHTDEIENVEQDATPVALPGHRLKLTREDLHLSKDEVAHHLHLDVRIVEALESDNYEKLPSPAYICGYLRSYARILKLPENEIVNAYSKGQQINAALIPESVSIKPEKNINPAIIKPVVIVLLVLLIAAGLMWLAENFKMFDVKPASESTTIEVPVPEEGTSGVIERPAQVQEQIQQYNAEQSAIEQIQDSGTRVDTTFSEAESSNSPDVQTADSPPLLIDEGTAAVNAEEVRVPVNVGDLRLKYLDESWTEVTDAAGVRHVYRLAAKGSEIYVDGIAPFVILLGKAEAVEVYYKNKLFDHKRYQRNEIAYFRLGKTEE